MIQTINSTMKIKFRQPRVFTFLLTLLLLCGVANQAWAAGYKVRYHILTLPFDVKNHDNSAVYKEDIRVEALLVVVNDAVKVGLPEEYKSPLATNFQYYTNWTSNYDYLYDYTNNNRLLQVKYNLYSESGKGSKIAVNADIVADTDIYVTYDYQSANGIVLDGSQDYNIGVGTRFLCYNRSRNNRLGNANSPAITGEHLASQDFVVPPAGTGANQLGFNWSNDQWAGPHGVHMGFWFTGYKNNDAIVPDPYNIVIMTAYNGNETYAKDPVEGDNNKMYVKPYKGATLFSKMASQDDGKGTEDKMWFDCDDHVHYKGVPGSAGIDDPTSDNYWAKQVDHWPGFYRQKQQPVFNSVAILNRPGGGYVFVASKLNQGVGNEAYKEWAPNKNNNYPTLTDANLNPKMAFKALDKSPVINIYKIRTYTFKIKKHLDPAVPLTEDLRWSDAKASDKIVDLIPETLKRKYCSYKACTDEALENEISTFEEAITNAGTDAYGRKVIWLKYETNMPFETSATSATYDDLKWYNIHADKNTKYIASWDGSKVVTRNVSYRYPRATHFAFIGDPYDLTIVGRKASENGSGTPSTLNYMKLATTITDNATFDVVASATTWGIVYDDDTADNKDCFRLKDNSDDKYLHIKDASGDNYPLNGTTASADAVRITVDELPKMNYTYYIMRSDNSIAVWTSGGYHEPSAKLDYNHIPKEIRSPFLQDVALTFYGGTTDKATAITNATSETSPITYAPDTGNGGVQYIVVRYDAFESSDKKALINNATYNVRLNGQYIYYDLSSGTIKSSADIADNTDNRYNWILGGADPYAMTIKSGISGGKFISIAEKSAGVIDWPVGDEAGVGTAITWSESAPSSKFIIKASDEEHTYEVMGATGEGDYNAIEEIFNFGRTDENTVKMYSDWKYMSGSDVLRFELVPTTARSVTYYLVDIKNNDVLLRVQTRQASTAAPSFPPEYRSPLVATYTYWSSLEDAQIKTGRTPRGEVGLSGDIYVTYTANDLVDMSGRTMYLLKYALGDQFRQEDGSDGLLDPIPAITGTDEEKKQIADANKYRYQAVYPYCNGDCNFFVYGQEQYDEQQQGAASTRTRWAWYVESVNTDPYHVKIRSRQQETYPAGSGNDYNAYFRTYKPNGYSEVVTTLAWPGISGEQGTEYMVLGSAGQFRLVTTYGIDLNNDGDRSDPGEDERRAVNSFEQYWKTWNTIRLKVLGDKDAVAKQSDPNTVPATPAAPTAAAAGMDNRTYLSDPNKMGWHSYEQWAYAIRWNDYNKNGDKNKKGWESIEHWYQTINMGEGYFDFVPTTIDPVLILLDQHGWEVMRKPLPSSPTDPDKYAKYDAIRPYDSPMVKEYHFWTKTSKRSGFHQYHTLGQQVTVDGKPFTSTSLTSLPPFDATNVHDAKGNLYDQYVTYTVKDEYLKACNVTLSYTENVVDPADSKKTYSKVTATVTGVPFLIQQGNHFVSAIGETTLKNDNEVPAIGGMSQYIINNIGDLTTSGSKSNELWYLMPNIDIDGEMGYAHYAHLWASDYDREDKVQTSGFNSWAFDPYNIQISSVAHSSSYFVTNASKAEIDNGSIAGNGANNALGAQLSVPATLEGGMDNRTIQMTNATFMAVQDKNGNMQLMPRFDQEKRLKDFSALVQTDDSEVAKTYTKLYRPLVYNYHIIDNSGSESLRYQSGGDLVPQTPEWFKSPLAKDYKYYKNLTKEGDVYTEVKNKTDISAKEITESLEGAAPTGYDVYVRYSYDETADYNKILQGKWLTMTLGTKDAIYSEGVKQGGSKPDPVDASRKEWQWKFLANSQTDPDPYAVSLYNRNTEAETATSVSSKTKFVLLNWYDNDGVDPNSYTLAVHGTGPDTYDFVNGAGMNTTTAATTTNEENVKSTSCSYADTNAKIELNDDVSHTFTYKVYTNGNNGNNAVKYGVFAVSAEQDNITIAENNYVPILPEEIRSPLLNIDQFKYYGAEADMGDATKELKNIFGLYEDNIYVRYTDYDLKATEYKVPNVKTVVDGKVARGEKSNDAALDIDNKLIYNIIWYGDNMMQSSDNSAISGLASQNLQGGDAFVWQFEGNDPYAIKIKHKKSGKYVVGTTGTTGLEKTATSTFMLLPSTDSSWEYGVLAKTGDSRHQLSGSGNTLADTQATPTPETPTKFIIFGLSTHTVIYHLVIANIGSTVNIPYSEKDKNGNWKSGFSPSDNNTKPISGSTQRDLTSKKDDDDSKPAGSKYQLGETINGLTYCVNAGHITLGDSLKVPEQLKRPNCKYFYYVEGVYTNEDCSRTIPYGTDGTHIDALDGQYRGLQITEMGTEPELLGKTVLINVEYQFDDGLTETNNGSDFVTAPSQKKWFTWETSDDKLAQYTGAAGFKMLEGHESHYTNDFLWSPVGDPYGFKMYNRYEYKTNGQTTNVMTTEANPADEGALKLGTDDNKAVYELFAGDTDGYFFVRPMLNNGVAIYNNNGTMELSSTNATEYTFGLSMELLKPYYDRAGYVGGLTPQGKTKYEEAGANPMAIQDIVYDDTYIVPFTPGYYRLHSQPDIKDLPQRYLSGYTHKTELTSGIPMHFYEKKGSKPTTFEALGATGYTKTAATQGQLPIVAPEYDPASIFHVTYKTGDSGPVKMSTQGLYVKEEKMTATAEAATSFTLMDIGGAVLLIHDNATPTTNRKYFCFDQSKADSIYDIQYKHDTPTDYAKWCLEPANNMGLYIETHSGGEEETLTDLWYYSSYCVPFDLLIADKDGDDKDHSSNAYTCVVAESPWPGTAEAARKGLHPKPIGKYNTDANECPVTYRGSDYFVPAGTPVLFSTKRAKEYIKATIPTTSPSTSISTIFSAKYLEQKISDTFNNSKRVYVFGPKMEGTLNINTSDGTVNAVLPSLGNTNVGFHLNANPNKEAGTTPASWTRHNYYVLHNRIYYKADGGGVSAPAMSRGIEFVPVIFGDEEEQKEMNPNGTMEMVGDGCIYDLMGRKVATREQVEDGSWWNQATPGVYILNGRKVIKK